jgi:hypothetical protein
VTVRRLHDTGRSGWWMFKPFLIGFWALSSSASLAAFLGAAAVTPSPALMLMAEPDCRLAHDLVSTSCSACRARMATTASARSDPEPSAPRGQPPALVKEMDEELGRMVADRRKEEFQDYYRARVLPAIERTKSARRV